MKVTKAERLREVLELLGYGQTLPKNTTELIEVCEAYKDSVVTELIETPTEKHNL